MLCWVGFVLDECVSSSLSGHGDCGFCLHVGIGGGTGSSTDDLVFGLVDALN